MDAGKQISLGRLLLISQASIQGFPQYPPSYHATIVLPLSF
jgi:hypothetical protein